MFRIRQRSSFPNENSRKEDVALEILHDQDVTQFRSLRSGWFDWSQQPCLSFRSVWICLSLGELPLDNPVRALFASRFSVKKDLHKSCRKLRYEERIALSSVEKRRVEEQRNAFVPIRRLFGRRCFAASVTRDTVDRSNIKQAN